MLHFDYSLFTYILAQSLRLSGVGFVGLLSYVFFTLSLLIPCNRRNEVQEDNERGSE